MMKLLSPTNGKELTPAGPGLLDDGERRWPVVDGIAYLRPKEELRAAAETAIRDGNEREALLLLLADQDRFSPTDPPAREQLEALVDGPSLSLRATMDMLNYGPVGEYFAYRWSSPTFASGLQLLEDVADTGRTTIEYACGIGHFLREMEMSGLDVVGIDIIFSKLWLARRCLSVKGPLVCGDVEAGPVVAPGPTRNVFCHDAFYFLEDKQVALNNMRAVASDGGGLGIGHVHTDRNPHAAGFSLPLSGYEGLTDAVLYDDRSLSATFYELISGRVKAGEKTAAISWKEGPAADNRLRFSEQGKKLVLNPILDDCGKMNFPSQGWREEYEVDRTENTDAATTDDGDDYRRGRRLNLPDKW